MPPGQTQATVVEGVLAEALTRPLFLRRSLGSEGMIASTVVMEVEVALSRDTIIHDPVRQARPEVSAPAALVDEPGNLKNNPRNTTFCARLHKGVVVVICIA